MKSRFEILLPGADTWQAGDWCWRDDWNLPGQSAFMLLARFQQLNALSCTALAELFLRKPSRWTLKHGIDLRDMQQFDLLRMSDLMCIPLGDVAAAFLPVSDVSRGAGPQQLMYCMQCAARGIHLTVFQSDGCKKCPVHGSPLRDRCIQCGEALDDLPAAGVQFPAAAMLSDVWAQLGALARRGRRSRDPDIACLPVQGRARPCAGLVRPPVIKSPAAAG
ncbi:hypothetical protein [Paraburkholderia bryophila]|uniref:TniQ protein n=1 Tax=Paraburkholderia bryophila TaxID=420952 RepID=A0A7Y9W4Z1_9BURK|nr:hypothetical protein [Paraburkholderia bryophila]NYH14304.1 hypothetical protein [Paraburkholderia bryophila]